MTGPSKDFVESSRAFAAMAEPDWANAMQEYLDHLANLEHAVANRQQEVMLHELRDLQNCMSSCHREFKSGGKNAGTRHDPVSRPRRAGLPCAIIRPWTAPPVGAGFKPALTNWVRTRPASQDRAYSH